MPKKNKTAKQEGMSPEQVAAANKDGISFLQQEFPMLTMDQGMGHASSGMSNLLSSAIPLFGGMIQSGYDNFAANPAKQNVAEVTGQEAPAPIQMESYLPETPVQTPVAEPPPPAVQDDGWGQVKTDAQAINWALQRGDITQQEAQWLSKWQGEANDGNNWVDGSGGTKNWDYMNSGLTNQNKGIVDKFYNSVSGNWGGQPAQQVPQSPAQVSQTASVGRPGYGGQLPQGYMPNGFMGARKRGQR